MLDKILTELAQLKEAEAELDSEIDALENRIETIEVERNKVIFRRQRIEERISDLSPQELERLHDEELERERQDTLLILRYGGRPQNISDWWKR